MALISQERAYAYEGQGGGVQLPGAHGEVLIMFRIGSFNGVETACMILCAVYGEYLHLTLIDSALLVCELTLV